MLLELSILGRPVLAEWRVEHRLEPGTRLGLCALVDNAKPSSSVQPLPASVSNESVPVQWSGIDTHSGIANFTVFVSEEGGPFQIWLRNTTETSAIYSGRLGKSYGFFSVARDNTGNVENA